MLNFAQKRYKHFILWSRYYLGIISQKLKTPFGIGALLGFVVYILLCYYALDILFGLVYDKEVGAVIDLRSLIFLSLFLASTLYINLILMIKIIWERFKRLPGTMLRFRIIGFFFLSIALPAILFIYVFNVFFDRSIAIFDDQVILRTMERKKWTLSQEIDRLKEQMNGEFDKQIDEGFSNFYNGTLTYVGVHDRDSTREYYFKKSNFSLRDVPELSVKVFLSREEDRFTSYSMEKGFVYQFRLQEYLGEPRYFVIISRVGGLLKNDIAETFLVIRQVKQFELLLNPFKTFTIIFLVYLYSLIFSVLAIVFYYSSNRYISPIAELIKATRQIIQGDYKLSLHRLTKRMGNNEIKDLLESFIRMSRELFNSRKRLERVSNIEAWKEVSQKLAHEIKNPLTPILLAKDHIEKHLIKNDFQGYHHLRENFIFIEGEIKRILSLLDEFNILSQQKLIKMEWVKMEEIVETLKRLLGNYAFIRWVEDIGYSKPVFIDKDKMLRVFVNLIRNAIESIEEAMSSGVKRDFSIMIKVYSQKVTKRAERDDSEFKNLVFEIWDNGLGISEEKREEIFKPYVTYKNQGTGLGLTICDEIVSLHQGQIENLSLDLDHDPSNLSPNSPDGGESPWTVFRITLPIASRH